MKKPAVAGPSLERMHTIVTQRSFYTTKLPSVRAQLIAVAKAREKVTYSKLWTEFDQKRGELRHGMDRRGHECMDKSEPVLTALVVDKPTRMCSGGLVEEFKHIVDEGAERQLCYVYWGSSSGHDSAATTDKLPDAGSTLRGSAIRCARAAVWPEHQAFRLAIFLACQGRCVVTGCDVGCALDAANLQGKAWKAGGNSASDGALLRRDLHAMYDAGVLSVSADVQLVLTFWRAPR